MPLAAKEKETQKTMTQTPLTVAIIAKNEEHRLEPCVRSVLGWAAEVVVLDDMSTDRTRELAQSLGCKVFQRAMDIEGRQRNFAYDQATQPWVLSLDADERVTPELQAEITKVISDPALSHICFSIPIKTFIADEWIQGAGYYPAAKTRLFKKGQFKYEEARVHPRVIYQGTCGHLKGDILHYSSVSLEQWISKFNRETTLEADKWIQDGRKVSFANSFRKTLDRFLKNYLFKDGYKHGFMGFLMSVFHGLYQLFTYAKYREMKKVQDAAKSATH